MAQVKLESDETAWLNLLKRRWNLVASSSLDGLHGAREEDSILILFLDFDGVTHPEPYDEDAAFQQLPLIEVVVRDMVGVEIVVSSSWRESHSLEELREFFALDIRSRVVGVTPDIWNPEQPQPFLRESECMAWLAANRPTGTRWLAIDDRPLWFQPNCPNLLVTDTTQGFLPSQIEVLRVMLMQSFGGL